jgi:hypothetical protein
MLSGETQLGAFTWAALLVLVVLVVVVAVLALNSTVVALQRRAARAKLDAPPTQPFRDVDSSTSGDQLAQQTQCPPTAPSGLVTRVGGSTQPFIVLHELHVGEQWLVKLLQVRRGSPRHAHTPRPHVTPTRHAHTSRPHVTPTRHAHTSRHRHDAGAPLAGADRRARAGRAGQGRQGPEGSARVALCRHERRVVTRCCSNHTAHRPPTAASFPSPLKRAPLPPTHRPRH